MVGVVGSNPIEPTNEQNEGVGSANCLQAIRLAKQTNATRQFRVAFFFLRPKPRVPVPMHRAAHAQQAASSRPSARQGAEQGKRAQGAHRPPLM